MEQGKKVDSPKGLHRTESEMEMLAEKAALLGRNGDQNGDTADDIPRLTSDNGPLSPSDERSPPPDLSVTSPGDAHQTDPLAHPHHQSNGSGLGGMSEKARGKMRAVDPMPEDDAHIGGEMVDVPDEELMKVAAAGVGPNGYVPTQEWVSSWQKG